MNVEPGAPGAERRRADPLGGVLVAAAAVQFGFVVVLGKSATEGFPVPTYLALRFGIAAILTALALALTRQPLGAAPGEGWRLAVLGIAGYGLESTLFFIALRHGGAAAVTLLFFTYPVIVTLVSAALGRGLPGRMTLGALVAAVLGAALVVLGSGGVEITTVGIAFALAAATVFALYLIGADRVLQRTNAFTGSLWVSGSAALGLCALTLATGNVVMPTARVWVSVVTVGAFTAGAFACLLAGLRRLGAVRTSIVAASEPLAAAILSVLILGETLYPATIAGGALILVAAVVASVARSEVAPTTAIEPPVP